MVSRSLHTKLSGTMAMALLLSTACREDNIDTSHIAYLQDSDLTCHSYPAARISTISNLPQGFLTGYQGDQMTTAINRLAGIPDRDLNHLVWTFQQKVLHGITPAMLFFGVAGLTSLTWGTTQSGFAGSVATSITTGADQAGFALQHEVGHAVQIVAREAAQKTTYTDFDGELSQMQVEFNSSGAPVRAYAKASVDEGWAEAYASYYCSEDSQNFIATNLPNTYKFLNAVLAPPPWKADQSSAGTDVAKTQGAATVTDPWFSALITYTESAIMPTLASVDFTQPIFATLAEKNTNINMALDEMANEPQTYVLVFAADPKIAQIFPCIADEATCSAKKTLLDGDKAHVVKVQNQINGRNFFPPHFIDTSQTKYLERGFFALGYDTGGSLIGVRKLMIKKK